MRRHTRSPPLQQAPAAPTTKSGLAFRMPAAASAHHSMTQALQHHLSALHSLYHSQLKWVPALSRAPLPRTRHERRPRQCKPATSRLLEGMGACMRTICPPQLAIGMPTPLARRIRIVRQHEACNPNLVFAHPSPSLLTPCGTTFGGIGYLRHHGHLIEWCWHPHTTPKHRS